MEKLPFGPRTSVIVNIVVFLFISFGLQAQSISLQLIGNGGESAPVDNISLSWTAGEAFIGTMKATDRAVRMNVGFQQPNITILPQATEHSLPITIFPNPTPDLVQVTLLDPTVQDLKLTLTNVDGKILQPVILLTNKHELDLSSYPAGIYFITIKDKDLRQVHQVVKY